MLSRLHRNFSPFILAGSASCHVIALGTYTWNFSCMCEVLSVERDRCAAVLARSRCAAATRKMGRPIVIAVQRATKQDHHGFVEVQPRISAESAAAAGFNTLPRNFKLRPPGEVSEAVNSATRRACGASPSRRASRQIYKRTGLL